MNDFALVRRNLFRRKLRAALMIFSILVAFAIFGVLSAFQEAFNAGENTSDADRLVVVNKINFTQPLPISYVNRVASVPGIRRVTWANWFGGYYQDPKNIVISFAVDPETYLDVVDSDYEFTPQMRQDFARDRTGALVGRLLAEKWGWKVGDRVPVSSNIFSKKDRSSTWDFTIVGIFDPKKQQADTNVMLLQYEYFDETRTFDRDTIGWMILQTNSPSMNDEVIKSVDQMFANSPYETATDTEKAFNKAFVAQLGNIALIVRLVVGAAFVTILMIVGNTMVMAVRERTREIAVLKTLGFSSARVLGMVLGETMLLSLIGGVAGLIVASAVVLNMCQSLSAFVPGLTMTPSVVVTGLGLMIALGLATGVVPALNAFRLKIVEAMGRG